MDCTNNGTAARRTRPGCANCGNAIDCGEGLRVCYDAVPGREGFGPGTAPCVLGNRGDGPECPCGLESWVAGPSAGAEELLDSNEREEAEIRIRRQAQKSRPA